jgi:peroxiredoxin Q/BCP
MAFMGVPSGSVDREPGRPTVRRAPAIVNLDSRPWSIVEPAIIARQEVSMLNPGDKAPDFTGRDHTGNVVKLADLKGKTVVLWFYPKADTPG